MGFFQGDMDNSKQFKMDQQVYFIYWIDDENPVYSIVPCVIQGIRKNKGENEYYLSGLNDWFKCVDEEECYIFDNIHDAIKLCMKNNTQIEEIK